MSGACGSSAHDPTLPLTRRSTNDHARLCQLEQLYPNCKTLQFGCQQQQGRVVFDWKLDSHSSQQSRYGLMLAPQVRRSRHIPGCWKRGLTQCEPPLHSH